MKKSIYLLLLLLHGVTNAAVIKLHNPVGAASGYFGDNTAHFYVNILVYDVNYGVYIINSYQPEGNDYEVTLPDDGQYNAYAVIYFYRGDAPSPMYLLSGFDYYPMNQDGSTSDNGDILQYDTTNFNYGLDKPYLVVSHEKGSSLDWNTQLLYVCIGFGLAVPYIAIVMTARFIKKGSAVNDLSGGAA